jgi:hypothetical protein
MVLGPWWRDGFKVAKHRGRAMGHGIEQHHKLCRMVNERFCKKMLGMKN